MSATDRAQRRLDVLQAVSLMPGRGTQAIAERAGYSEKQVLGVLRALADEGAIVAARNSFGPVWNPMDGRVTK